MRFDTTFLIAATVVIVHFILAIGLLVYKVMTAEKKNDSVEGKE